MDTELDDCAHPLDGLLGRGAAQAKFAEQANGHVIPGAKKSQKKKLKLTPPPEIILNGTTLPHKQTSGEGRKAGKPNDAGPREIDVADNSSAAPKRVPRGAILVEAGAERNLEMTRLLKPVRYFDEDFEAAAMRCFNCGGSGHLARDCRNEARQRPCHICALLHPRGRCPNTVCYRCSRPGHVARDCPNPEGIGEAPVCLRCGQTDCIAAGDDLARCEGECTNSYSKADMKEVRCLVCQQRGHLSCVRVEVPSPTPSCANCGEEGHTHRSCSQVRQPHIMSEEHQRNVRRRVSLVNAADPTGFARGYGGQTAPVAYRGQATGAYNFVEPQGNPYRSREPQPYGVPIHRDSAMYGSPAYGGYQPGGAYAQQTTYSPGVGLIYGQHGVGQYGVPRRVYTSPDAWQYGVPPGYRKSTPNSGGFQGAGGYDDRWQMDQGGYNMVAGHSASHRRF